MPIRIISAAQVSQLLPMADCVDVMAAAMKASSRGEVGLPPRTFMPLTDQSGFLGLMPGSSEALASYGAKLISLHPGNPSRGLPAIQGFVALFDHASGEPVAIVEGAALTGLRTAAASGLATRLLAREDAHTCGLFGTGVQAVTHIDAMLAVRDIDEFRICGRSPEGTAAFARAQTERTGVTCQAVDDPAEAGACDIVCTVTASPEPVLKGDWVAPGAHVNLVGAHTLSTREADSDVIAGAGLYVDLLASCHNEGGDFMIPVQEGVISEAAILGEIGQLLDGSIAGRQGREQVTVYNSLGITTQDLFAARAVFDRAVECGVGAVVDLA